MFYTKTFCRQALCSMFILNVFLIVKLRYCNNLQRDDVRKKCILHRLFVGDQPAEANQKFRPVFLQQAAVNDESQRKQQKMDMREDVRHVYSYIHGHLACCIAFSIAVSLDYTLHQAHALVVFFNLCTLLFCYRGILNVE